MTSSVPSAVAERRQEINLVATMARSARRIAGEPGRKSQVLVPLGVELAAAFAVLAVFWIPSLISNTSIWKTVIGGGLGTLLAMAMLCRWRTPTTALGIAAGTTAVGQVLEVTEDPMVGASWCLYALAVSQARRARVLGLIVAAGVVTLSLVSSLPPGDLTRLPILLSIAALGTGWLLGHGEGQRLSAAEYAARAKANAKAQRLRAELWRDVHDVVGHALSVVSAEAGVLRSIPGTTEAELRDCLGDMEQHARTALTEIQSLMRTQRNGEVHDAWHSGLPTQGLSDLSSLVESARSAGLEVVLDVEGATTPGTKAELIAFQVIREALTNTIRHAPGEMCRIRVRSDESLVELSVQNDLPSHSSNLIIPGNGLLGMKDRVEQAHGSFHWRAEPKGGFEISARIPWRMATR